MSLVKLASKKTKKNYTRGAIIGGTLGALAGGIGSFAAFSHYNPRPELLARSLSVGIGAGGLLGTGIGSLVGKKESR